MKFEDHSFKAEFQTSVKAELDTMFAAPHFSQSDRCKRFLSYVVLQTLAGNASQLKERTIGIVVFERATDYDTGQDSIVRVTANEIRKRIGQFYRESRVAHPIQIELPKGAYVPEFRIHAVKRNKKTEAPVFSDSLSYKPPECESLSTEETKFVPRVRSDVRANGQSELTASAAPRTYEARRILVLSALLVLLMSTGAATIEIWRIREQGRPPSVWDSFLRAKVPILICLGTHDLNGSNVASSPDTDKFSDAVLNKQQIPIDDAAVVTSMASILGKKGIPFRVVGAEQVSLTDLRSQPVILIGAANNRWSPKLTQDLRYRIEVVYPSGPSKEPIASIVDAEQPTNGAWRIDFSVPLSKWNSDYAIVARVDDPTTGVPVLIEAGLGNNGGLAASESIISGALETRLADEASCRKKSDFEAVIETDIIDAKRGPPHILRLKCW